MCAAIPTKLSLVSLVQSVQAPCGKYFDDRFERCSTLWWAVTVAHLLANWPTATSHIAVNKMLAHEVLDHPTVAPLPHLFLVVLAELLGEELDVAEVLAHAVGEGDALPAAADAAAVVGRDGAVEGAGVVAARARHVVQAVVLRQAAGKRGKGKISFVMV